MKTWGVLFLAILTATSFAAEISGPLMKWHAVTLTFDGPETGEEAADNPFLNYRLNVSFSNGSETHVIPGYYAADGDAANTGANSGNKWRCHFVPSATGEWTWQASFRYGFKIGVSDLPTAGKSVSFDGDSGSFTVTESDKKIS